MEKAGSAKRPAYRKYAGMRERYMNADRISEAALEKPRGGTIFTRPGSDPLGNGADPTQRPERCRLKKRTGVR